MAIQSCVVFFLYIGYVKKAPDWIRVECVNHMKNKVKPTQLNFSYD